jgi:hypothetical protein
MPDIVQAMEELFINRSSGYAIQLDGLNEYKVIKEPVSKDVIAAHLAGKITIGAFQINPEDNKVKWICFDFDGELNEELQKAKKLYGKLKEQGYSPLLEFSGRRGYHVWLFVEPVDASIAKKFATDVTIDCKPHEIFPKQDKIEKDGFGGQVKLPLGVHRVSSQRSSLFDDQLNMLSGPEEKKFLINVYACKRDVVRAKNINYFLL